MKAGARCLQLDVGNSSAKWRLTENGRVSARGRYAVDDPGSREAMLNCTPRLDCIWIASVASAPAESTLATLLTGQWGVSPWFARTQARTGDLCNSYSDPSRMGVDRWLAMLAGRARAQRRVCVVDAGSALTIDLVDASGQHEGGYIIPGPALMERALLLDTDRVRFDDAAEYDLAPGTSTAGAVRHGIALAQAGALALVLERTGADAPALIFCGGGGEALMQLLQCDGDHVPELVFEGLELLAAANGREFV